MHRPVPFFVFSHAPRNGRAGMLYNAQATSAPRVRFSKANPSLRPALYPAFRVRRGMGAQMWLYDSICPVARVGRPARPHAFFGPSGDEADFGRPRAAVNARGGLALHLIEMR